MKATKAILSINPMFVLFIICLIFDLAVMGLAIYANISLMNNKSKEALLRKRGLIALCFAVSLITGYIFAYA